MRERATNSPWWTPTLCVGVCLKSSPPLKWWVVDYYKTLKEWKKRFYQNREWVLKNLGERFFRMWDFYLTASAVSFLVGSNYVFQILLSKDVFNQYPVLERKFGTPLL